MGNTIFEFMKVLESATPKFPVLHFVDVESGEDDVEVVCATKAGDFKDEEADVETLNPKSRPQSSMAEKKALRTWKKAVVGLAMAPGSLLVSTSTRRGKTSPLSWMREKATWEHSEA